MFEDVEEILIETETIAKRVEALAAEIGHDLARLQDKDESLVIVPILTGSLVFVADLVRCMPQKMRIGVTSVTSYPGKSTESIGASLVGDLPEDLEGRHVLIVDDIFDTGRTVSLLRDLIKARNPASIRVCVLLRKLDRVEVEVQPDYVGFDIPDHFVVGYGLDFDGHYRNLPYIGTLAPHAINPTGESRTDAP
ncbi:MAG: hypoxanthine phosphoribosyltransferase [Phycisphaerales bacterium]|nr:hypoxanthine phosphoribosyltransferase [Phycisphaerales bacterium]